MPDLQYYLDKANREIKAGFTDPGEYVEIIDDWNFEVAALEGNELTERFGKLTTINNKLAYKFTDIVTTVRSGTTDASGNTGVAVVDGDLDPNFTDTPNPVFADFTFHNTTDSTKSVISTVTDGTNLVLADSDVTGNTKAYGITTTQDPDEIPTVISPRSVHFRTDGDDVFSLGIFRRRIRATTNIAQIREGIKGQRGQPFYTRKNTLLFYENPGNITYDVVYQKTPINLSAETVITTAETKVEVPQDDLWTIGIFLKMTFEEGANRISPTFRPAWEEIKIKAVNRKKG